MNPTSSSPASEVVCKGELPALTIRETSLSSAEDHDAIAEIIMSIAARGDTYSLKRDLTKEDALEYWFAKNNRVFVAALSSDPTLIVGT